MVSHFQFRSYVPDAPAPTSAKFSIPDNAVLFGYSYTIDTSEYFATTTSYGTIGSAYSKILWGGTYLYRDCGTPFIKCAPSNTNWNFINGGGSYPSSTLSNRQLNGAYSYATQLDGKLGDANFAADVANRYSGKHGWASGGLADLAATNASRAATDIPTILGYDSAKDITSSTTASYFTGGTAHTGHYHIVMGGDIFTSVSKLTYGSLATADFNTGGLNLLPVQLLKKDSTIPASSGKPVKTIPKGILVLGNDIETDPDIENFSQYYTMNDTGHGPGTYNRGKSASSSEFSEVPLFMVYCAKDYGVMTQTGGANTIPITVTSNTSGLHSHDSGQSRRRSTRTGQTGARLGPGGAHNHEVTYTTKIEPKSKWLNGWITTSNETPLANGMIIGYSPLDDGTLADKTDNDLLPPYWHFCDGNNGTPDLRDYFIAVNMNSSKKILYNTEAYSNSILRFTDITSGPSSGEIEMRYQDPITGVITTIKTHSHVLSTESGTTTVGTPIPMPSNHAADPARWHTHSPVTKPTFNATLQLAGTTYTTSTYVSILPNSEFSYSPANLKLVFIMLNKAIQ